MRRWGDNDKHLGPFTFAFREKWRPFAIVLSSGSPERESPGCCIRFQAFGGTMICELPPVVKPWRRWVDLRGKEWAKGDGYWDGHPREYGFMLNDGHLSVKLGAQTNDSSTTQDWGCFLPWTQWRHVRHSLYGLQGEEFYSEHEWQASLRAARGERYEIFRQWEALCPVARFKIRDFDGEEIVATTRIEERAWLFGTGWFKWLSWFRRPKIRRSLSIDFSAETGPEKGSWKGGTMGEGIEMLPGELHEAAFRRYCDEEHRSKYRKYRVTFLSPVSQTSQQTRTRVMDRDEAIEIAYEAMDNIQDYDTTLRMYARAAVDALGWHDLATTVPEIDQVVVCTNGTHRWLDKRTIFMPDMQWQGHTPTHWHPILELPTPATAGAP